MIKIYLKPVEDLNHRTWYQLKQGLEKHELVELVDSKDNADFIFIHWYGGYVDGYDLSKVVYFDFNDYQRMNIDSNVRVHRYFKRSMVSHIKEDGTREQIKYSDFVVPISHASIMDEFKSEYINHSDREYDLVTTFRGSHNTNKLRVEMQNYIRGNFNGSSLKTHFGVTPNDSKSSDYDLEYHSLMRNSKIIITMNPLLWEGDNRLYEAIASGALVFCDNLYVDIPNKFKDGEHLIYYNARDYSTLIDKVKYYLDNSEEREKIAKQGYDFAMKHHTPKSRIDYILKEITNER